MHLRGIARSFLRLLIWISKHLPSILTSSAGSSVIGIVAIECRMAAHRRFPSIFLTVLDVLRLYLLIRVLFPFVCFGIELGNHLPRMPWYQPKLRHPVVIEVRTRRCRLPA